MQLGPLWRLRQPLAAAHEAADAAAPQDARLPDEPVAPARQPEPASAAPLAAAPIPSRAPAVPGPDHVFMQSALTDPPVERKATLRTPSATGATPGPAHSRSAMIAAMDWSELEQGIRHCQACDLCQSRTQAVPGVGDRQAPWLVVGEAPGAEEDRQGEPFVGRAGQLLDNMLAALGLQRGQGVYIANVLKCRPPANRDPEPAEIAACRPWLLRQIELIRPQIILCVGRHAAQTLLATDAPVGQLRGRIHDFDGIPLVVSYHPAYLLRSPEQKARAWQDLLLARSALQQSPAAD